MKKFFFYLSFVLVLESGWADVSSSTPAAGYAKLGIMGDTDNLLSLSLATDVSSYGVVASVTKNSVTIVNGQWTDQQFVASPGTQTKNYYLQFITGALQGVTYPITYNNQDTVILTTGSDDLTAHRLGTIQPGDIVAIQGYWSVNDILGSDDTSIVLDSFTTTPTLDQIQAGDCVLFPDNVSINYLKPPMKEIAYVKDLGWRSAGDIFTDNGTLPLPLGTSFIVHRHNDADIQSVVIGNVVFNPLRTTIQGGNNTSGNDFYTGLVLADPINLNASNLTSPNSSQSVVQYSINNVTRGDELLVYSGTHRGFRRAPDLEFYYLPGSGWSQFGSTSTTVGSDFQLQPGMGFIIRKRPSNLSADWLQKP